MNTIIFPLLIGIIINIVIFIVLMILRRIKLNSWDFIYDKFDLHTIFHTCFILIFPYLGGAICISAYIDVTNREFIEIKEKRKEFFRKPSGKY